MTVFVLGLIAVILVFGYWRLPLIAWTLAIAALVWYLSALAALIFLAIAGPFNIPILRRRLISDRILAVYRRVLPDMSQTEKEALDAGTVWWDADLFSGRPDWDKLLAIPAPRLSPEEQAFLDGPVEELCAMCNDWEITHELQDLPAHVWQFIKDKGFLGMIIPKKYGGLGFSALAHSAVVAKLSTRSSTAAISVMVPNSLGPGELLLHYGTEEQKNHYLPRLAKGLEIPCAGAYGKARKCSVCASPGTSAI
jgi:acyl-CoA dehydrogenase